MSSIKTRAASAAWWSTVEISCRFGVKFIGSVVLARLLLPEDFGLIAMLSIFTSIGALFVDSGFGTALIQRQDTTKDDETTVFAYNICAGIVSGALLALAAPWIADFFAQPKLLQLTRAMALTLPLSALATVPDALLAIRLDFKSRARAEVIASLVSSAVAILLAFQGYGVWSLVWQPMIALLMRTVMLWHFSGWRPRGRYSRDSFRGLFGFGGYMLLSGLLGTFVTEMQSLLIGKLFDSRSLGFYSLAQNTQQAPASFMGSLLNRVGLPVFSAVAADSEKLKLALRSSLQMAMFLFVPCMVGIAVVARPLIAQLYGPRWEAAAPILSVLALSGALWPVHVLNLTALGALGRSNLFFLLAVIKSFIFIPLILISARDGPIAIAWAVFVSNVLGGVINTHYSKRYLGYGVVAQMIDQSATFAMSAAAACVGWAILHWTKPSILTLIVAISASAGAYLSLAILIQSEALRGLRSAARTVLRPSPKTG